MDDDGYARVAIKAADGSGDPVEYTATVRMIRPNGQTGAGWLLGPLYEGYTGMTFRVGADDQTLEVACLGDKGIVVYLDYFHHDGRPWFEPPQSSQDTITLRASSGGQNGGQMHTFSVKAFCEIP